KSRDLNKSSEHSSDIREINKKSNLLAVGPEDSFSQSRYIKITSETYAPASGRFPRRRRRSLSPQIQKRRHWIGNTNTTTQQAPPPQNKMIKKNKPANILLCWKEKMMSNSVKLNKKGQSERFHVCIRDKKEKYVRRDCHDNRKGCLITFKIKKHNQIERLHVHK
ncbi:hypothetical protein CEXT_241871, partial [Caerostris extrusa]